MKKPETSQSKFMKIIKMPIRALAKARDFYVRAMNNYADSACGASAFADPLPRSFSTASVRSRDHDDADLRELVRVLSTNKLGNRVDLSSALGTNNHRSSSGGYKGVPRSASVGMAKIEEDKPIEFNDDILGAGRFGINKNATNGAKNNGTKSNNKFGIFPRSRSYAVGSTNMTTSVF